MATALHIRCCIHKINNILVKVSETHKTEVRAFLTAVKDAPDYASGYQRAEELIERFEKDFPRALSSLQDGPDASLPCGEPARAGRRSGFQRSNRAIVLLNIFRKEKNG